MGMREECLVSCREQCKEVDFKSFSSVVRSELAVCLRRCTAQCCWQSPCGRTGYDVQEVTFCMSTLGGNPCFCSSRWSWGPSLTSTGVERGFILEEGGWGLRAAVLEMWSQTRSISVT